MTVREGFAQIVRDHVVHLVEQKRTQGKTVAIFRVGALRDVVRPLLYEAGIPPSNIDSIDIGQILRTRKFRRQAYVERLQHDGSEYGNDATYYFRILR